MVVDRSKREAPEEEYIRENGMFTFKISGWETNGFSQAGNAKFKIHFIGKRNGGDKDKMYKHSQDFVDTPKAMVFMEGLENAIEAPNRYEMDDIIGHYLVAKVWMKPNQDGSKAYSNISEYSKSPLDASVPRIVETKKVEEEEAPKVEEIEVIEIDESIIPF